ncbi:MAG: hypothetical protein H6738_21320 [Alphaproteobacteria bacterium]|nr:hypothetical protein [Alphaproteobacteria bacterium]
MFPDGLFLLLAIPDVQPPGTEIRVHWSPDDRWLVAADARHLFLWSAETWELVDTLDVGDADPTWLDRDTMAIVTPDTWFPWTVGRRPGRPRPRPEELRPVRNRTTLVGSGDGRLLGVDGDGAVRWLSPGGQTLEIWRPDQPATDIDVTAGHLSVLSGDALWDPDTHRERVVGVRWVHGGRLGRGGPGWSGWDGERAGPVVWPSNAAVGRHHAAVVGGGVFVFGEDPTHGRKPRDLLIEGPAELLPDPEQLLPALQHGRVDGDRIAYRVPGGPVRWVAVEAPDAATTLVLARDDTGGEWVSACDWRVLGVVPGHTLMVRRFGTTMDVEDLPWASRCRGVLDFTRLDAIEALIGNVRYAW